MRAKEFISELKMAPGTLQKWAAGGNANEFTVGFEAELIFPGFGAHLGGAHPFEDYPVPEDATTIDDIIELFGDDYKGLPKLTKVLTTLFKKYHRYLDLSLDTGDEFGEFGEWLHNTEYATIGELITAKNLKWPDPAKTNARDLGRSFSVEGTIEIGAALSKSLGVKFKVLATHNQAEKDNVSWYLEPDPSIQPKGVDRGLPLEIISPPMLFSTAIKEIPRFFAAVSELGAVTNASTGLHISVSSNNLQNTANEIDYIKLALFTGDQYVLSQFQRSGNKFALPLIDQMDNAAASDLPKALVALRQGLNKIASRLIFSGNTEKYAAINVKVVEGYVEFRAAGNTDYHSPENSQKIIDMMNRYVFGVSIAVDDRAYQQEYSKKLYKLMSTMLASVPSDTVQLFSDYVAGSRSLDSLKNAVYSNRWNAAAAPQFDSNEDSEKIKLFGQIIIEVGQRYAAEALRTGAMTEIDARTFPEVAERWGGLSYSLKSSAEDVIRGLKWYVTNNKMPAQFAKSLFNDIIAEYKRKTQ
jgi:hypothetical protein